MSSEVTALAANRLFSLSNSYVLDGRASSHPVDVRGYAPMQAYLAKEDDEALLIGTGLTIHQDEVMNQIETLIGSARLSLMPLSAEFPRICNARPIADRFGVERIYERRDRGELPGLWLNVRPEFVTGENDGLRAAEIHVTKVGNPVTIGHSKDRMFELVVAPLRLLPNPWMYDVATKTLFTGDVFTWVGRSEDIGPWTVTQEDKDETTFQTVRHALIHNRYWWLAGAETSRIRDNLAQLFERYDVENIAPDAGCVLRGSGVVNRHYQLLNDVLAAAQDEQAIGVEVGNWRFE